MTYFSEKNMTYAAAHPGTLPLGDSELQAKMKRKFSVTADSTHVRVACSYTCGETGDEVLGIDPSKYTNVMSLQRKTSVTWNIFTLCTMWHRTAIRWRLHTLPV